MCCGGRESSEGCPYNPMVCAEAAYWGHLQVLKWANGLGCLWDRNTSFGAASSNGHLEAMQGAREQGCECITRPVPWQPGEGRWSL